MSKRIAPNKLSIEEIENRILKKFGDNIEIINIVDSKNITIKSNVCGHKYTKSLQNILKGKPMCKECAMKDRSKLHLSKNDFYIKYASFKKAYDIVGDWKTSQDKTTLKCKNCNRSWNAIPYLVAIGKSGCPYCSEYTKASIDTLYVREKLKNTGFELLSECDSGKDEIELLHIECGNIFKRRAGYFIHKLSCPECKSKSIGEEQVIRVLKKYNIKFKRECVFKDLRGLGGGYLRYDFGIYSNNELKYFIEYDGIQHSGKCDYKYFKNSFEKIKKHDEIKNQYCKDNNYILLRISHKNRRTIEKIVVQFLKEHMLISEPS